ncbi:MAG: hypothetical protein IIW40_04630, partial [Clostridia bacterium]|nr:hypothetical protein [Clostridia bacterium]
EWEADYLDLPYYTDTTIRSAARLASAMSVSILQDNFIWLELNELAKAENEETISQKIRFVKAFIPE